ncbi:MAG: DUF460 domain-containing protein [archaeon]
MGRTILIVGIDPGTTVGLCLISLDRRILHLSSSKNIPLSEVIRIIVDKGRTAMVGCDKANPPEFAKRLATKLGARLIHPREDLGVEEKRVLTSGIDHQNDHELDAAASALIAYGISVPLRRRIVAAWERLSGTPDDRVLQHSLELGLSSDGLSASEVVRRASKAYAPEPSEMPTKQKEVDEGEIPDASAKLRLLRETYRSLKRNYQRTLIDIGKNHARKIEQQKGVTSKAKMAKGALASETENIRRALSRSNSERQRLESLLLVRNGPRPILRLSDMRSTTIRKEQAYLSLPGIDTVFIERPQEWDVTGVSLLRRSVRHVLTSAPTQNLPSELKEHMHIVVVKDAKRISDRIMLVSESKKKTPGPRLTSVIDDYRRQRKDELRKKSKK